MSSKKPEEMVNKYSEVQINCEIILKSNQLILINFTLTEKIEPLLK